MLRGGTHGQHGGPIAVGAQVPSSANDTFAVLPQDLDTALPSRAEPKGWGHPPDSVSSRRVSDRLRQHSPARAGKTELQQQFCHTRRGMTLVTSYSSAQADKTELQ